jgi:2-polyprenyl-3-methyl-5-hydroxy-6-metoxy-1,4-benzoquinol methylase
VICEVCAGGPLDVARLTNGLLRCASCGVLSTRTDPTTTFDDEYYRRNYTGAERDSAYATLADEVGRQVPAGGRVLDVGCGSGGLLSQLAARGYDAQGVDPSPAARDAAGRQGLDVATALSETPEESFDAVLLIDVIAHVRAAQILAVATIRRLRAGGALIVKTPATTRGLAVTEAVATRALHTARSPLLHRGGRAHHFDRSALRRALWRWGLDDVRVEAFEEPRVAGRHYGVAETAAQLLQRGFTRGGSIVGVGVR